MGRAEPTSCTSLGSLCWAEALPSPSVQMLRVRSLDMEPPEALLSVPALCAAGAATSLSQLRRLRQATCPVTVPEEAGSRFGLFPVWL